MSLYRGSGGVRYRDRARWQVDHGGDLDLADEEAVDLARSFVERHLHVSWMLTAAEDAIDAGTAHDETVAFHRFLVNAAKYTASRAATQVVREGIEILGGNGTIEDSSVLPLPRLYRDAMVYESWEGTHNVIAQQVLNDSVRLDLLNVVGGRLESFGPLTEAVQMFGHQPLFVFAPGDASSAPDPDEQRNPLTPSSMAHGEPPIR